MIRELPARSARRQPAVARIAGVGYKHRAMDNNKPYLTDDGVLVVPFQCPDHSYKYWKKEGKPVTEILKELNAPPEVWARYTTDPYPGTEQKDNNAG